MAKVTAQAIVTEARGLLSDTIVPYRWSDNTLLSYLLAGELLTVTNHSESQYDTDCTNSIPVLLAIGGTTTLCERWQSPLAFYISFRALMEDSDDENNVKLAEEYRKIYEADML